MYLFLKFLCIFVIITQRHVLCLPQDDAKNDDKVNAHSEEEGGAFRCISCNSKDDVLCMIAGNARLHGSCVTETGQCYSAIEAGALIRGCVGDELFPDKESTKKCDGDAMCSVCDVSNCNNRSYTDMCIRCESSDLDSKCRKPTNSLRVACSMMTTASKGCFLKVTGDTYSRGCMQDIPKTQQQECADKANNCQSCLGRNCNKKSDFNMKCYQCNSLDNKLCTIADNMTQVPCDDLSHLCGSGVDKFGITHRLCSAKGDINPINFPQGFEVCSTELCNSKSYMDNRTWCYKCKGDGCDVLRNGTEVVRPELCNFPIDECYSYLDKDDNVYRGCVKDYDDGSSLCMRNSNRCKKCDFPNCNVHSKKELGSNSTALRPILIYSVISVALLQLVKMI